MDKTMGRPVKNDEDLRKQLKIERTLKIRYQRSRDAAYELAEKVMETVRGCHCGKRQEAQQVADRGRKAIELEEGQEAAAGRGR